MIELTPAEQEAMRRRCQQAAARMRANEEAMARAASCALAEALPAPKRRPVGRVRWAFPVLAMVAIGIILAWAIVKVVPVLWALANWEWFYI
jgi:hypothetical protein